MSNTENESRTHRFKAEDADIKTRYIPVPRWSKWTFESPAVRKWVEGHLQGRTLNACAGKSTLNHSGKIIRNDINPERAADIHTDVAELSAHFEAESFDTVVFDPPWSTYQSNLRYDGKHVTKTAEGYETKISLDALPIEVAGAREKSQIGHARLAKEGFAHLLRPGGRVIELTFHGSCMPSRLGFKRVERVIFDPIGEGKSVIGSVDMKAQTTLTNGVHSEQ